MESKVLTPKELEQINSELAAANSKAPTKVRKYSTRYRGVYKESTRLKSFKAAIRINKKLYALGYYYTDRHAAYVYDMAATVLHGDKAKLNFKPDAIPQDLLDYFEKNPVKLPELK